MTESPRCLRYEATAGFLQVLDVTGCTLAISIYMSGRVLMVSAEDRKLHIQSTAFHRPMGIATATADGERRMAIATFQEIVILADAPLLASSVPDSPERFRHLLVPRAAVFCGDIDAHDLVWVDDRLFAANTRFSCIAEVDARYSFVPVWVPPFVSAVMPEDRCHLNGLATAGDRIAYATAFARTDSPRGWSEGRLGSGVVMAVPSGEVVLDKLCMPHSPRVFDGELFVLDSGTGGVLKVDAARRTSTVLAALPGFTRGLDRLGDILFVGLSRIRIRPGGPGVPPVAAKGALVCGIAAIDRRHGHVLGYLRFDDAYEEIFDVKVLANVRRGATLGVGDDTHRRALALPRRAFWGEPLEDVQARRLSRD